jgi:hypothetical protein
MVELLVWHITHLDRHRARQNLMESSLRAWLLLMPLKVTLETNWLTLAYVRHELIGKWS